MVYHKNLNILKDKHITIYDIISSDRFEWEDGLAYVDTARNQEQIIVYKHNDKDVYLNSKYNPSGEAKKYMEEFMDMPENAILTIFGLSNGSFVREVLNNKNLGVLIMVYEPSVDVFMQVIQQIDISDILMDDRFVLVVEGINAPYYDVILAKYLRAYNKNTSKHITLPKYVEIFSDAYENYRKKTLIIYEKLQIAKNTFTAVGKTICKNNVMNLRHLPGCRSGEDYINHFPSDMPAIVVSAGPSLAKNKHLLKEAKGKALIMVVDTAISHVMSMGVEPDVILTVDFNKDSKYFEKSNISHIPFVVEPDSSYKVLDQIKPENVIFCGTDIALWKNMMISQGSDLNYLDVGGSVATVAIAVAIKWGIKKIILIGQDLAFTGGSMHIGEQAKEYDFSKGIYSYVKGINGEKLVTQTDYLSYLKWIERTAFENSDVEIIDATEGGALIENTTVMEFQEAIDKYCIVEYDISKQLLDVKRLFQENGETIIIEKLLQMKNTLKKMKRIFSEGASDSHRGGLMLSQGDYNVKELKKINSCMQKVDKILLDSDEKELLLKIDYEADNAFEEDMYEVQEDDIMESIRMYEKCEKYYNALSKACINLSEYVDECLRCMEG